MHFYPSNAHAEDLILRVCTDACVQNAFAHRFIRIMSLYAPSSVCNYDRTETRHRITGLRVCISRSASQKGAHTRLSTQVFIRRRLYWLRLSRDIQHLLSIQ